MAWNMNAQVQPTTKETIGEGHSSLHHTTVRMLNYKKNKFHDLKAFEVMYDKSITSSANQSKMKDNLFHAYSDLLEYQNKMTDEEKLINRMERKAQIRNVFFRGATTLIIGFSIMFVYFMASKLEIAMPLLRIPI